VILLNSKITEYVESNVIIRVTDQTINLEDETNLKAFHVDAGGFEGSERALLQFLDQIGQMEPPDHAWVTEEYLRNVNRGIEHQHVIDQLVEIAKKHDWYDDAAKAIKAHIEY
jgi:hypothetical protein